MELTQLFLELHSITIAENALNKSDKNPPTAVTLLLKAALLISGEAPKEHHEEVLSLWRTAYHSLRKKFDSSSELEGEKEDNNE